MECGNIGCVVVRASSLDSYSDDDFSLLPPLQLKSSIGQLLQELLQTKPHLFSAAIDEQLLKLNGDKTVSLKEKHNIIEDLIYCLVVKRFKESNISMIRYVSSAFEPALIHPNRWKITHYPEVPPGSLEAKLETIHTREAL
ncbi:hypothetical protein P8452_39312 [Trifolium repens]|nr:hypothetical protein P8452_39312 [Trifolium repens]